MGTAKAIGRLHRCAGSPEPLMLAFAVSALLYWSSRFVFSTMNVFQLFTVNVL